MKLVVYAVVGIVTMLVAVVLVYVVIRLGGAIRGVDIDATGESTLADYARQIVVAGLITTFGVALGALFRAQVITVAGTLIWALVVENIVVVLKPAVGAWLPFTVFDTVSAGQMVRQRRRTRAAERDAHAPAGLPREPRLHRRRERRGRLHLVAPRRHLRPP